MHSFAKLLQRPVRVLEATEVELHVGATVAHQDSPMLLHAWIYHPSKTQNRKRMRKKKNDKNLACFPPHPHPFVCRFLLCGSYVWPMEFKQYDMYQFNQGGLK